MMLIRVFYLLLAFSFGGCAGHDDEESLIIIPDTIDIGRVRDNESLVNTSFSITNSSFTTVCIDKVQAGCGCTMIDLPQKTIRPKDTIKVPVKINLLGRKGEFKLDILVSFTSGKSRYLYIIGEVIEDGIWCAEQPVRLHVERGQKIASKSFHISTIDYPDIQLECNTNAPDSCLSELYRSTQNGETKICFLLTVYNVGMLRTSFHMDIIPKNADLPKLTIPVFYYSLSREKKQLLATSQINLGEIKQDECIVVRIYGDRTFLRNIHKVCAASKNDALMVSSHIMPSSDSNYLEVFLIVNGNKLQDQELVRGDVTLFSSDNDEATVQVNGIFLR